MILRLFGAKIGKGCKIAPSCFVWAPWNLQMGNYACLADGVDCYSVSLISMMDYSTVSQRAFLCGASHDISKIERPLIHRPIVISKHAWICAEAFVGPGVIVGEGAVVGSRGVVMKSVEPWVVIAGNPAVKIKDRKIS
jgi:putative colanic acid biosynthesis acetyltransferase WcaF